MASIRSGNKKDGKYIVSLLSLKIYSLIFPTIRYRTEEVQKSQPPNLVSRNNRNSPLEKFSSKHKLSVNQLV